VFYLFPKVLTKKKCETLLNFCIQNTNFSEASVLNKGERDNDMQSRGRNDPSIRKTDIAFVTPDYKEDNEVNEIAWHFLAEANEKLFNYKFESFQPVQFARYRDGGHYGWHQDSTGISPNGETRKLSLTFSLTDPHTYEGGHLEFYGGEKSMQDQHIKTIRDQGTVIVFDSRDYHRVTPVTKGVRYSIVCWTVGPNFV
jgi:PKHD-type hydroxylase